MIKANELRIGDYVKDRGDKILRIDWFEHDKVCLRMMLGENEVHPMTEYLEYLKPIPLTPEILEKAGFVIVNHIHGYSFYTSNRKKHKSMPPIDIYDSHTDFYGYRVRHCAYVHQLQNLYFALTGNELEINL